MKVTLRLHQASQPMYFTNILNCYTKGEMYCLRLPDGDTLKFPLTSIFSVLEGKAYTSQEKK